MSTALTGNVEEAAWKPKVNPWIIGVAVSLAAFMELLDVSIANVALPHIAGNLGVSNDDSTWVLTMYLVANAIVLPTSGFLVSWLGRKRCFLMCVVFFTASSFLCGIAPTLGLLLLFRVMQGAFGGGLQPMVQAILADTFPPKKRGLAFALYGVTAVFAPAIGPTVGGWITDNYSWRWIFYINVPVGALAFFLVHKLVEDPPWLARVKKGLAGFDYIGFSLLAFGVGALQVALDRGQENDWFGSRFITTLIIIAAVGLVSLAIWEWRQKDPIVDVRLFKSFNFASCNVMFFVFGIMMMSSTVLLPQFLQLLMGYTAERAGFVLSAAALVSLCILPIAGRLTARFQARHILAVGWMALAIGLYVSSKQMDLLINSSAATWLRALQNAPTALLFVPMTVAAYVGLPKQENSAAAGLMNFMRNIGMSVGTSIVTTMIARRSQYHQSILAEHTRSGRFQAALQGLSMHLSHGGLSLHEARRQGLGRLYGLVEAQAAALSYVDAYWILAVVAAIMFVSSFLLKRNEPGNTKQVSVH